MLHQKQGTRVRIASHENVIDMSDVYNPNGSICSCIQCDSIACFNVRNINSGIPCTCTDCDPNRCLTWEIKKNESKPNNETRNMNMSPEISKNSLNVPETKLKCIHKNKKSTEREINIENEKRKEKISFSYLDKDLQNNTSDDPELKEVYTKEEQHIEKCDTMKKLLENKNSDGFEIKDASSYENSDIIECDAVRLEKKQPNDPDIIQVLTKDGSDTKICCSKKKTLGFRNHEHQETLTGNEIKNKQLHSKINVPPNDSKELLKRRIRNSSSKKNVTSNTKSDSPEVYQIYTNEKKNVVKYCNITKDLEDKHADAPENKQEHPENEEKDCKDGEDIPKNKTDTTELNTMKMTGTKCNHEHPVKDNISDIDFANYTKYTYKDVSTTRNKINFNKNNKSYEKYVSRLQSVAISYARPEYDNSRAELSAQIMNVPYERFKDSLSRKQSLTDSNTYKSSSKLDKIDIFSRLKEIYKACSCKVCECIAGKSFIDRSDICKCGPCDCDDCNGLMAKLQKTINYAPHSGCPCVSCDRKDCRGVVKSTSDYTACDCKPCDCLRCSESFTKPCSCTPCQCDTCQTSIFMPQTVLVANAAESLRQSNCDCEPCECTNCTSRYSAMTSNLMREVSTGMISYGNCNCQDCSNNTCQLGRTECRCDSQHKVVRKPIVEKKPDYGIHRAYIQEDKHDNQTISNNNHDTITMFAFSNNYPNGLFNNSNKINTCECDVCECIVCNTKGKGSVINKSLEIDKPNSDFNTNTNPLNICECSPCACQSCKSLHADNVEGKCRAKTEYDACNCRICKHLGYNYNNNNNNNNENYNFKKGKSPFSTLENNCMCKLRDFPECKNLVNVHSQNSTDTDEVYLHDKDKFNLKKGTLRTPTCNEIISYSSDIHIKPEKDSLRENYLGKKIFTYAQNTELCRSKSHRNYFDTEYEDIINDTLEATVKVISAKCSLMNMVSKEAATNEIFKINSVDFKKGNLSKVFYENFKSSVFNDDSNTMPDAALTHMNTELSSHCDRILENNKDINKYSHTSLLDRQEAEDFSYNMMSSSNNEVHFSSSRSMSLVKLLCKERNLNIDNIYKKNYLQSLEKIPLKRLKMNEENVSFSCDENFNDDIFFDCFAKNSYSYSTNNNLLRNMDQDNLDAFNCENKKSETDLTDNKFDINDKIIVKIPVPKTTKHIKPKEKSNFQVVKSKPNNYNITAKGSLGQPKITKTCSRAKVASSNVKRKTENHSKGNINEVNNKRYLEVPDIINTATSAINFTESDKIIDFEKSFKLLREAKFSEIKKSSPILRKNFLFSPEVEKNNGMNSTSFELDVKNAIKSTSLQTNTTFHYCPGIGFGNIALTKLQTEVNDLLYSPLLELSPANTPAEKFRSKTDLNPELNSVMSDATSQTKRNNIVVDKEINCNMIESSENLRQSIKNLINMTLTNIVQPADVETGKQNFIKDFNKTSSLNAATSSCGGLKASFVGLRKVSDHSVLLKWAKPHDLSKIQGYELQVDGRPVKEILNPSRCMAVLTCLPHCEKLLLTIRTLTEIETCYNPVTTIVYNPKKNKSGVY